MVGEHVAQQRERQTVRASGDGRHVHGGHDHATVVVGTVIDENMGDELRVTVVATGLGNQNLQVRAPRIAEDIKREIAGDGVPDYSGLDRPTVIRNAAVSGIDEVDLQADKDLEYLDIPAFLRRQAD